MHENYIYVFLLYISENGQSNISIICLYKKNRLKTENNISSFY